MPTERNFSHWEWCVSHSISSVIQQRRVSAAGGFPEIAHDFLETSEHGHGRD